MAADTSEKKNLIPIPLASFFCGRHAHVDIFLEVSPEKFVKVFNKGDEVDIDRIKNYGTQRDVLFVPPVDYQQHVAQMLNVLKAGLHSSSQSPKMKLQLLSRSMEAVFVELVHVGVSERALSQASDVMLKLTDNIEVLGVSRMLESLAGVSEAMVRNALAVSVLSVMTAQAIGWKSVKTLNILAMGGFLHDIGFRELPSGLWEKKRSEMTPEEVKLYESHPTRGADLLRDFAKLPPEVIAIVYEHHEKPNGTGFPRGLTKDRIFPLSRCVAIADEITKLIVVSPKNPEPKTLKEAIQFLEISARQDWDNQIWMGLQNLLESEAKRF